MVRLAPERKLLTNLIKMVAYQAESDLVRLVAPCDTRVEAGGRTLIRSALAGAADLVVTSIELRVVLAPLGSPHRTRALAALCRELEHAGSRFPGSPLRLRCPVAGPGRAGSGRSPGGLCREIWTRKPPDPTVVRCTDRVDAALPPEITAPFGRRR